MTEKNNGFIDKVIIDVKRIYKNDDIKLKNAKQPNSAYSPTEVNKFIKDFFNILIIVSWPFDVLISSAAAAFVKIEHLANIISHGLL